MLTLTDIRDVPRRSPVFIYGTGQAGIALLNMLRGLPDVQIAGFLNSHDVGELEGLPVLTPADLAAVRPSGAVVLIASQYVYDIIQELKRHGVADWINAHPLIMERIADAPTAPESDSPSPLPKPESVAGPTDELRVEVNALYTLLYHVFHDLDHTPRIASLQTEASFQQQWRELPTGKALLSDPWFRDNVARLIWEEELQIRPDWLRGKRVLDCGCGNGRWSYGLAQLGAQVTAVDINLAAVEQTGQILASMPGEHRVIQSPLERLDEALDPAEPFDLVWSWGVLHHCASFTGALRQAARFTAPGGLLHLYLYGRESLPLADDVVMFKKRLRYNTLATAVEQEAFLLREAKGDRERLHNVHDVYAPLINRRFEFDQIPPLLRAEGFTDIQRTKAHTELFIRAVRGDASAYADWFLPEMPPPYWFQRY